MLVKIFLLYFEVNITFWVKKSLASIIGVGFEIVSCLLYELVLSTSFLGLLKGPNFIFNIS